MDRFKSVKKIKTYLVKGSECILMGKRGDHYGHVKDIVTGETFGTYGYPNTLIETGNTIEKVTYYKINT